MPLLNDLYLPTFKRLMTMLLLLGIATLAHAGNENSDFTNYGNDSLSGTNDAGADNNTAIGQGAMSGNLTSIADGNTAIGYQALYSNTSGRNNIATGEQALYSNTSGNYNVATL